MSLARWNPFGEVASLRNELNRILEGFPELKRNTESLWPRINMKETENDIVIEVEVPGVEKDNIKLNVTQDNIVISGDIQHGVEQKSSNYLYQERRVGSFSRVIALPADVDAEKAKASYQNGVVHIVLPKLEDVKRRTVRVDIH